MFNCASLKPEVLEKDIKIKPGSSLSFYFIDYKPQSYYEVRVSYPAINPAVFSINVESVDSGVGYSSKTIQNIEKEIFKTNEEGGKYLITVSAERESPSYSKEMNEKEIHFNLIVERMIFGVITVKNLKFILFCLGLVVLILVSVNFINKKIEVIIHPKKK